MSKKTKNEQEASFEEQAESTAEQATTQQDSEQDTTTIEEQETLSSSEAEEVEQAQNPALSAEELQQKLAEAQQKAEENYQKLLRTQADFDNFRRRTRLEKEEQAKYAALPLLEKLLPVIDNFERALQAAQDTTDSAAIVQGVEMVFRQVEQVLSDSGLEAIPAVGEAFDPNVHQAVMQEESSEYEAGTVTGELQKGYKLKDKVIRPAMVKVSS